MRPSRADEVAARVVAWHNRHPLALRITSAQVQGVGVVSLPMFGVDGGESGAAPPDAPSAAPPQSQGATLRERAQARASADVPATTSDPAGAPPAPGTTADSAARTALGDRGGWQAAFSEDFLPPLRLRHIADFALAQGAVESVPAFGPRRQVPVDERLRGAHDGAVVRLVLHTAAVQAGSRRVRVLLGGDAPAVLGRRLWSRSRALVATMAPCLLVAVIVAAMQPGVGTMADPLAATPTPTFATASESAAVAAGPVSAAQTVAVAADLPSSAAAVPPFAAALPSQPRAGGPLIDIRPRLSAEVARDAKRTAAALRAGQPLPPPASNAATTPGVPALVADAPAPALAPATTPPAEAQAPAKGRVYAVVARGMRTRMAAGVMLGLMQGVANPSQGQRTEVLPSGGGWRATWWPFENTNDARRAQEVLARAGLPAEIVEF